MGVSAKFVENLIRGICHDLGAPARHVVQFSQLFEENASGNLDDKQQKWLGFVGQGGRQIQDMLSGLSLFGSLLSNLDYKEEISSRVVFDEVISLFERLALTQDRQLAVSCTGDWPTVFMNKNHLVTLFSHLVENAYLFQDKDSGHQIQLIADCSVEGENMRFSLDDNGVGVTDAQIETMTRAFKRLNSFEQYPGYGMGLAYCELISELNDAVLMIRHSATLGGLNVTYLQPMVTNHSHCVKREDA